MINISIKCHPYASQLCLFLFSLITPVFYSLPHGNVCVCVRVRVCVCVRMCVFEELHIVILLGEIYFHIMKFRKANKPSTELIYIYMYIYIYIYIYIYFRWWHIYTCMYIVYIDGVFADISIWQLFRPQCIDLHILYLICTNYTRISV